MLKTMILNVGGLETEYDIEKITDLYDNTPGVDSVSVDLKVNLVVLKYNDETISHTKRLLDSLEELGYEVK